MKSTLNPDYALKIYGTILIAENQQLPIAMH